MSTTLLCGHTGSKNRGCEAIIRSTSHVLKQAGVDSINCLTHDQLYDLKLNLDNCVNLMDYPQRSMIQKAYSFWKRKVFNNRMTSPLQLYTLVLNRAAKDTILFNVGGDTYCYHTPRLSYALNRIAERKGMSNIFWGCSVDERCLNDTEMQEDLNRYAAIVVRETKTYDLMKQCIKDSSKVLLACDPAFHLPIQQTEMPAGFKAGNTLGLNLSDLVFIDSKNPEDILYKNIRCLIDHVLQTTDMSVCLIPHVYSSEDRSVDLEVLDRIKAFYPEEERVMVVDQELSCTELKYIISNCRFFIGARTHATIAAYSTGVPAIALSYSIKSRGIAKDIFGTEEGYVVPYKTIDSEQVLKDLFEKVLWGKEKEIRERYELIMPEYKQSILDAAQEIKRRFFK